MIDTPAKRCSAIATRRLPWFRRFMPLPDATMDQGDRQQLAFVYRGILAGELEVAHGRVIATAVSRQPTMTAVSRQPTMTAVGR